MRDVVFLFGAGASAGAGSILPERPPLGGQLFAELRRLFPGSWGLIPSDLQDKLSADFEDGMRAAMESIGMAVPQLMRDMAIYFIAFRPVNGSSLYDRLVVDLATCRLVPRTICSTLNYECILEFALLGHGIDFDYFGDGSKNELPVWKLHGSCNMFSAGLQAGPGIGYGPGVAFEGGIQAWLDASKVIEHCLRGTALAPVMCQYMAGKPTSVSPSAVHELQARWAGAIDDSSRLRKKGFEPPSRRGRPSETLGFVHVG